MKSIVKALHMPQTNAQKLTMTVFYSIYYPYVKIIFIIFYPPFGCYRGKWLSKRVPFLEISECHCRLFFWHAPYYLITKLLPLSFFSVSTKKTSPSHQDPKIQLFALLLDHIHGLFCYVSNHFMHAYSL